MSSSSKKVPISNFPMTASLKHNGSSGASGTGLLSGDFDYDDLTERQDSEQIFPTLLEREDYE